MNITESETPEVFKHSREMLLPQDRVRRLQDIARILRCEAQRAKTRAEFLDRHAGFVDGKARIMVDKLRAGWEGSGGREEGQDAYVFGSGQRPAERETDGQHYEPPPAPVPASALWHLRLGTRLLWRDARIHALALGTAVAAVVTGKRSQTSG